MRISRSSVAVAVLATLGLHLSGAQAAAGATYLLTATSINPSWGSFTVNFTDAGAGDGLLQHDEITVFSGVHYLGNFYVPLNKFLDITYAQLPTVPVLAGISTYSGFQYQGQNPAYWAFDIGTTPDLPSATLGMIGVGAGYWSYQLTQLTAPPPVPEPASLLLLGLGLGGLALQRRRTAI